MVDLRVKATLIGISHVLCLLTQAAAAQSAAARLVLWTSSDRPLSAGLSRAIRAEVAKLVVPGFDGIDLNTGNDFPSSLPFVVSVRLKGHCNTASDRSPNTPKMLGYVMLTDGKIAPFLWVQCDAILSAIKPLMRDLPPITQNALFARAIVHVIEHELRHILEQTASHLSRGVFKAYLHPTDLIVQSVAPR